MKKNNLAVLSTVGSDGLADSAPIYFTIHDNFDLYFITPVQTNKYLNLTKKKDVVISLTNETNRETVQFRGIAFEDSGMIPSILAELSIKLNQNNNFISSLPLMLHHNQAKAAIKVKPYKVRLRKYFEDHFVEEIIEFN